MFRKGLSRTFPFSAHALPAFRLSRKLLLDVDGVSDCAAGSDSAVLRTTAHATAHARRPKHISTHLERRASDESENRLGSHSTLGLDGLLFLHSGGQSESEGGMSWTRAVRAWGSESWRFAPANHNTQTTINYIINLNDKPE